MTQWETVSTADPRVPGALYRWTAVVRAPFNPTVVALVLGAIRNAFKAAELLHLAAFQDATAKLRTPSSGGTAPTWELAVTWRAK